MRNLHSNLFVASLLLSTACDEGPGASDPILPDGSLPTVEADASDADTRDATEITERVMHLPEASTFAGSGDLYINDELTIDTTALTVGGNHFPAGGQVVFDTAIQEGTIDTELAVLHVGSLTITKNSELRVIGDRPLLIVAGGQVAILGTVDASADLHTPGPGGFAALAGAGAGTNGELFDIDSSYRGAGGGGGGAGYGSTGGLGGPGCDGLCGLTGTVAEGGAFGESYGETMPLLLGGSGGGQGATPPEPECDNSIGRGGAGGGALQIYAAEAIWIPGHIYAGGGGGEGGYPPMGSCAYGTGGGGGGSGGAIYLQAPALVMSGSYIANGGGGGAGANRNTGGANGRNAAQGTVPAAGGQRNEGGSEGGAGGAGGLLASGGGRAADHNNGGGGGGSVGRIVVNSHPGGFHDDASIFSPAATVLSYP